MYLYQFKTNRSNSLTRKSKIHKFIVLVALILLAILFVPPTVFASSIIVTTTSDVLASDGECSLREAVLNANSDSDLTDGDCEAGSGADVIQLAVGTYVLTIDPDKNDSKSGALDIWDDVTIIGMGAENTIIDADGLWDRVFSINANTTIRNLTVTGGDTEGAGAAFSVGEANLAVYDSVVTQNKTHGFGGAFATNAGTITVENSSIENNIAYSGGGAAYVSGWAQMNLVNTAVLNNQAGSGGFEANVYGGGVYVDYGSTLNATNVTFSDNTAGFGGGAIYNGEGELNLLHVTIAENDAKIAGGAIYNDGTGTVASSIIVGNQAAEGNPDCEDNTDYLVSNGNNLLSDTTHCPVDGNPTDVFVDPSDLFVTVLDHLGNNGGIGATYAVVADSPALGTANSDLCPATDQRGVLRPQGVGCEIGAYELEEASPQTGPFYVNTDDDVDDNVCDYEHCSLREAINAANDNDGKDSIYFDTDSMESNVIEISSALPDITHPVIIDGVGLGGEDELLLLGVDAEMMVSLPETAVTIDGTNAGEATDGFVLIGGDSEISSLIITNFDGNGIVIGEAGNNVITNNEIANSGENGVLVFLSTGNKIQNNNIYNNGLLGIDLNGDGPTINDKNDGDNGANNSQNFPHIIRTTFQDGETFIEGRFNGDDNSEFLLEFYLNEACDPSGFGEGQQWIGSTFVETNDNGNAYFGALLDYVVPEASFITATATDVFGNTSEFSKCASMSLGNDSWPRAYRLPLIPDDVDPDVYTGFISQYLDQEGQSRWYKFKVEPDSQLIVTLTNLPENYDLTVYTDIAAAYNELISIDDEDGLTELTAEFAPDAFSPDSFSPDSFSPDSFSPDSFSPDSFSPDSFSADVFSPDSFSPDSFSPDSFSPDSFSPDSFSPDSFSPDSFSPDSFSPDSFSPDSFSPDSFSSAQTRSLIAVSAYNGNAGEGVRLNTWENSGDFYVRVRGRNGVFSLAQPFDLQVQLTTGNCSDIIPNLPASSLVPVDGDYETIILTDMGRMAGSAAEISALHTRLAELAARPEVNGVVVDVASDTAVSFANTQADNFPTCPFAKNMVAQSIKNIVDGYWNLNPLQYIVIVGNDNVIPFFRHPDQALLANERNYVPPVSDNTASQASLKLGYVLSQDRYGSRTQLNRGVSQIPIPLISVGRLVETATDATGVVEAYLATANGVVPTPTSSLVTGYDFLEDAALEVSDELQAGIGVVPDQLITPRDVSPEEVRPYPDDPTMPGDDLSWTADHLRDELLGTEHDIIYLAGHFSASSALAADYDTRLLASEVAASDIDLVNVIVFSAGCHSGYNIVNEHGIPGITPEPDWAQAFAQKQALLIAGTGYQYGDTDFIEYSERLYSEFSEQLRAGTGAVSVGDAMVRAKQNYLAQTPELRPIHEKSFLEATIFGLPMLSVNLPQGRGVVPAAPTDIVPTPVGTNPGLALNLQTATLNITPNLVPTTVELDVIGGEEEETVTATYMTGADSVFTNPAELVLPVEIEDVTAADYVLRGVGFRGGSYTDLPNIVPLTGAPTTEIRGVHVPFLSNVFYPIELTQRNYYDVLARGFGNGRTYLNIVPTQYMSNGPASLEGTLRQYNELDFQMFYSNYVTTFESGNAPAQADSPTISGIRTTIVGSNVVILARVYGDPAAGIQNVWATFTGAAGPYYGAWQSVSLNRSNVDSTIWTGSFPLNGSSPEDIQIMLQAVNGVGLVSLATNMGEYYSPVPSTPINQEATTLQFINPPTSGEYGDTTAVSARLTSDGDPVAGQFVKIAIGSQQRTAVTDENGVATAEIRLLGLIGNNPLRAVFAPTDEYLPSFAVDEFTILPQSTAIELTPQQVIVPEGDPAQMVATLSGINGLPLTQSTVIFVITSNNSTQVIPVITNNSGRAPLSLNLPVGVYDVDVYFSTALQLPQGNLNLGDDRFQPSMASGSIIVGTELDNPIIYMSMKHLGELGGVSFRAEDVLAFDPVTESWSLFFDGSDVGLSWKDVDAFAILEDDSLLISTSQPFNMKGFGKVDDSDILRFVPTSLGENTAGTFEWYFDGSDVGLTKGSEDIDGLSVLEDGRLLISTSGTATVTAVQARDEDMLIFTPTSLGSQTTGIWAFAFDGSDVGLAKGSEDINGISASLTMGQLYLTTQGNYQAQGLTGSGADILQCTPTSLGEDTNCELNLIWDATLYDIWDKSINALHIQN